MRVWAHFCGSAHASSYVYVCACMRVCMRVCVRVCMCVYANRQTYTNNCTKLVNSWAYYNILPGRYSPAHVNTLSLDQHTYTPCWLEAHKEIADADVSCSRRLLNPAAARSRSCSNRGLSQGASFTPSN